ncbi:MAG: hypothetical protein ACI4RL_00130 [Ruminococcus sp.]
MLKKPVCPHCRAIYEYSEINNQRNNEEIKCHNCKKIFTVKKTGGYILLMSMAVLFAIAFNIFLLTVINIKGVITLFVSAVLIIIVALLLRPFFVRYKKPEGKRRENQK